MAASRGHVSLTTTCINHGKDVSLMGVSFLIAIVAGCPSVAAWDLSYVLQETSAMRQQNQYIPCGTTKKL